MAGHGDSGVADAFRDGKAVILEQEFDPKPWKSQMFSAMTDATSFLVAARYYMKLDPQTKKEGCGTWCLYDASKNSPAKKPKNTQECFLKTVYVCLCHMSQIVYFVSHKVNQFLQKWGSQVARHFQAWPSPYPAKQPGVLSTERLWTGTRAGRAARQRVRAPVQSDGCWAAGSVDPPTPAGSTN